MGAELDLDDVRSPTSPGIDPPSPRLTRPIQWRREGDRIMEHQEAEDRWVTRPAWHGDVLEGLAAQESYRELVARYLKRHPDELHARWGDYLVRRYLFKLLQRGVVDMAFPPPPARFGGRYEPLRVLGRGGFGVAWLARAGPDAASEVVVKRAWAYFHAWDAANASLDHEAELLQKLRHPGVVAFHESFREDSAVHLVREALDGPDLAREGARPVARAVQDAIEVARIVQHVHEHGYLFLDVAPSNFIRDRAHKRLVAFDLGLCMEPGPDGVLRLKGRTGSRGYTAPEIRLQQVATAKSDVWSLGRLLYVLRTQEIPNEKWDEQALRAHMGDSPLSDVILDLCRDDPAARPDIRAAIARLEALPA